MKRFLATTVFASLLGVASTAGATGADSKFQNGVPFRELAAEIQVNNTAITELQTQTAALQTSLATLSAEVSSLKTQVNQNTADIAALDSQIDAIDARLRDAVSRLTTLGTQLRSLSADVQTNAAEIESVKSQIASLQTTVEADLLALSDMLRGLKQDLDAERASIAALQSKLDAQRIDVANQLGVIWTQIAQLKTAAATAGTLVEQVVATGNQIALVQEAVKTQALLAATRDELAALQTQYLNHRHTYSDYYRDLNNIGYTTTGTTGTPTN